MNRGQRESLGLRVWCIENYIDDSRFELEDFATEEEVRLVESLNGRLEVAS